MRGAISSHQNLHFAAVSRDRPTGSYERVHPAKSKCAFRYSGVPSKIRFTTAACAKMYETSERCPRHLAAYKNHHFTTQFRKGCSDHVRKLHFTTVLDVRRARSDERVARAPSKFAFHHSFVRPTITSCVKGCFGDVKNLHFTTVLGVRRSLFALRVASAT